MCGRIRAHTKSRHMEQTPLQDDDRTEDSFQKHLEKGGQILKTRDDPGPILLERDKDAEDSTKPFKLPSINSAINPKARHVLGPIQMRNLAQRNCVPE